MPIAGAPGRSASASPGDKNDGDGGRYQHVLRVVRALCAHDETLAAGLGATRAGRAPGDGGGPGGPPMPAQVIVHAPDGTLARTLDALRVRILEGTVSSWWDGYGHARAYRETHGHLDVPGGYAAPDGFGLGGWLIRQRIVRHRGQLADDPVGLLDALA